MQQRGTQAAHNAIQQLGRREEAYRKQYIHIVANELVTEAVEHDCETIVFEDRADIRERLLWAKWHHIWVFRRLFEYVSYKAPERGSRSNKSNRTTPRNSARSVKCGFTHERNRSGTEFECLSCGYRINADYNGAKNIRLRYARQRTHALRSGQKSPGGDGRVNVRLNRGTMTDDGPWPIAAD